MIEQINTYFTVEMLYLWLNFGVLPFWFVFIVFPQSQICKLLTTSIFPIFIMSIAYGYLLYILFTDSYNYFRNFELYLGINELMTLFSDQSFLILFWVHFLSINLFCGGWMVRDSQKFSINKFLMSFPLLITYFIGPIGILFYWLIRIFYAKRISLHE